MISAIRKWMADEMRLLALDSWAGGAYHGPPDPHPCTARDPRCARLLEQQEALYKSMRRMKSHMLDRQEGISTSAHTDIRHTIARALKSKPHTVRKSA